MPVHGGPPHQRSPDGPAGEPGKSPAEFGGLAGRFGACPNNPYGLSMAGVGPSMAGVWARTKPYCVGSGPDS